MTGEWGWRILVPIARALYMSIVRGRSRCVNAKHVELCDLCIDPCLDVRGAAHVSCMTLEHA
jgi:hypothetical protein